MCVHENSSGLLSRSRELSGYYIGIQAPAQRKSIGNPALRLNATAQSKIAFTNTHLQELLLKQIRIVLVSSEQRCMM